MMTDSEKREEQRNIKITYQLLKSISDELKTIRKIVK